MSRLNREPVDTELGRQIRSDLEYLQKSWNQVEIDDDFLRRDSVILRRLLIDEGGGILRTYRRQLGHRGDLKVMAVDFKAQLEGLDRSQVKFATAGGATHMGLMVAGAVIGSRGTMNDAQMKAQFERGLVVRRVSLTRYLQSTCMVIDGRSILRHNVIQYIANRRGGVHFDPTRDRSRQDVEAQFVAMDGAMEAFSVANKRFVYFELLAIGQTLLAAPDVAAILAPPSA